MRTLAFVERNQEYDRFVQKVVKADIIITYDISGLWLLLRNLYLLKRVETIVLVGLRTVDIELVKFLRFIRVECIVLQHAVNENRSAYQFKTLVSNIPKIFKFFFED